MLQLTTHAKASLSAAAGAQISAVVTTPPSPFIGVAVLLHGIATNKSERANFFVELSERLAANAIASVRFDFRGHGESANPPRDFTVASQVIDCLSVVSWIRDQLKTEAVHLIGFEFSAPAALSAAILRPTWIKTVNLIGPVLDFRRTYMSPDTKFGARVFNPERLSLAFKNGFVPLNKRFNLDVKTIVEMESLEPFRALPRVRQPVLILHGKEDTSVPFYLSEELAGHQENVILKQISPMSSGFTAPGDEAGVGSDSRENLAQITAAISEQIRRSA